MADIAKDDLLEEAKTFKQHCETWLNSAGVTGMSLMDIFRDNRARYQMQLKDSAERTKRNLSVLRSTKSTAAVDRTVDRALQDYHGDPDGISFSPRLDLTEEDSLKAKWLSEDFKYRCGNTFPFFTWHCASLTAGFTDGLEAAMVSWKKESYTEKKAVKRHFFVPEQGDPEEIPEDILNRFQHLGPDNFMSMDDEEEEECVVTDTFWIDQLDPGKNLFWDMKSPLLNLNMGRGLLVIIEKSLDDLINMAKSGTIDKVTAEDLEQYRTPGLNASTGGVVSQRSGQATTVGDPDNFDMGDLNCIPLWIYFKRVGCQWKCFFSAKGEKQLSGLKDVNDLFFRGRKVHRLPVVMGTSKLKLWEAVGRGLPETIAPIEDEWSAHRNNINDAAKMTIQGRYRLEPTSRIKVDDLINAAVFRASKGEYEKVDQNLNLSDSMRAAESINADMTELIPIGMENRQITPRGTTKTLGAVQLALGQSNEKLSVQLMVRNETFLKPLLSLIAELLMAFETDSNILRIAAIKAGFAPMQWQGTVDFRQLDFPVQVSINAGLGSMPRQQKAENALQLFDWGKMNGIRQDTGKIYRMLSSLAGFEPEQFVDKSPQQAPPKPVAEMKLAINTDFITLPIELQQFITERVLNSDMGSSPIEAKLTAAYRERQHNGMTAGGMPSASPADMTGGQEAEAMSVGGQNGSHA
jgi:hypothetical protein